MQKYLYPNHPLRCIVCGPPNVGKSVFLTNLILSIFNDYIKIYFYSTSLHQDSYQKTIKCFSKYIPIHKIPNILNEEDIDAVIEEIPSYKEVEKSDNGIMIYESVEELKFTQEYDDGSFVTLDGLNEKNEWSSGTSYV